MERNNDIPMEANSISGKESAFDGNPIAWFSNSINGTSTILGAGVRSKNKTVIEVATQTQI